jgi:hypothetical protein
VTIQLRYLQTLSEVSANEGSTIVFPLPMDMIRPLLDAGRGGAAQTAEDEGDPPRLQPRADGNPSG